MYKISQRERERKRERESEQERSIDEFFILRENWHLEKELADKKTPIR